MKGYVRRRGDRYYAVIYEGLDPVTGKERRAWHPAGTDRSDAERLAAKLGAAETRNLDLVRSLTLGAYLLRPEKQISRTLIGQGFLGARVRAFRPECCHDGLNPLYEKELRPSCCVP